MKEDKNILSIGIVIVVVALLIGSFYFIGPEQKGSDISGKTPTFYPSNGSEIIINVKDAETSTRIIITAESFSPDRMPDIEISPTEILHNTKPVFKIGDKFEYLSLITAGENHPVYNISEEDNISSSYTYQFPGKTICNVIKKERLKGEEHYVVECNYEVRPMILGGIMKTKEIYYISTENGEVRKVISNSVFIYKNVVETIENFSEEIQSPNSKIYSTMFYSPWMLSLSDDFKMEIKAPSHPTITKIRISVVDEEKIKDRDCYVVEARDLDKNNNVLFRRKMWIDKEKRILVREETYVGNLRISAIEMVSDIR